MLCWIASRCSAGQRPDALLDSVQMPSRKKIFSVPSARFAKQIVRGKKGFSTQPRKKSPTFVTLRGLRGAKSRHTATHAQTPHQQKPNKPKPARKPHSWGVAPSPGFQPRASPTRHPPAQKTTGPFLCFRSCSETSGKARRPQLLLRLPRQKR